VKGDVHAATINVATVAAMVKSGQMRALAVNSGSACWITPTCRPCGARLCRHHDAAVGRPVRAGGDPEGHARDAAQGDRPELGSDQVRGAYAKQMIRPNPTASLDEARTWLAGEVAKWKKVTAEIKVDLTE